MRMAPGVLISLVSWLAVLLVTMEQTQGNSPPGRTPGLRSGQEGRPVGREGSVLRETGFPVALCARGISQNGPHIHPTREAWVGTMFELGALLPPLPSVRVTRWRGLQGRRKRGSSSRKGREGRSLPSSAVQRSAFPRLRLSPEPAFRWRRRGHGCLAVALGKASGPPAGLHAAQPLRGASLFPCPLSKRGVM